MSYSWGDDSSVSSGSGGYNYDSARNAYDPSRGYSGGNSTGTRSRASSTSSAAPTTMNNSRTYRTPAYENSPNGKILTTQSTHPMVISLDMTGSMGSWRDIIISKLPLLWKPDEEITRYYPKAELSFAAIGDGPEGDTRALQVCEFTSGKSLDQMVKSLCKQNGYGNQVESYDLAAYFYLHKCEMPKAKRPLMFIAGDEGFYQRINPGTVQKFIGDDISEQVNTAQVFEQLKNKFDVYVLRKKYGWKSEEHAIDAQWKEIFGDKVIMLEDPARIVDTILGIVADSAGQFDQYSALLSNRQTPEQVGQVMNSIRHLASKHVTVNALEDGVSLLKLPSGKKSRRLR